MQAHGKLTNHMQSDWSKKYYISHILLSASILHFSTKKNKKNKTKKRSISVAEKKLKRIN